MADSRTSIFAKEVRVRHIQHLIVELLLRGSTNCIDHDVTHFYLDGQTLSFWLFGRLGVFSSSTPTAVQGILEAVGLRQARSDGENQNQQCTW